MLDPASSGNCDLLDAIRWATDEIALPADCEKAEVAVTLADEAGAKNVVRRAAQIAALQKQMAELSEKLEKVKR